jgi:hypothetical protein
MRKSEKGGRNKREGETEKERQRQKGQYQNAKDNLYGRKRERIEKEGMRKIEIEVKIEREKERGSHFESFDSESFSLFGRRSGRVLHLECLELRPQVVGRVQSLAVLVENRHLNEIITIHFFSKYL